MWSVRNTRIGSTCIAYIIPSTMPSNRISNDIDLVQPTQYNTQQNRPAKNPPPEPWPLPDFTPFQVDDFDDHNQHDPSTIFKQFFTDEITDKLIEWTNKYAELHPSDCRRKARSTTGLCKRQGHILGVKYVGFRSAERTRVGYLILSDSTLRNKLYTLFYMIFSRFTSLIFLSVAI